MRIQFPNAAGKQVVRRDYLGARSTGGGHLPQHLMKLRWKQRLEGKSRQILAVEDEPGYEQDDDDAYYEDEGDHVGEGDSDEAYHQGYSDDDIMDVLLNEFPDMSEGSPSRRGLCHSRSTPVQQEEEEVWHFIEIYHSIERYYRCVSSGRIHGQRGDEFFREGL